jgi:hypothetical protein
MKISRKQLRRLIETTIKPSIPNIPSDDAQIKVDNLADRPHVYDAGTHSRTTDSNTQADIFADALGYPEDRSYSDDLETYRLAGRVTYDFAIVSKTPGKRRRSWADEKSIRVGVPFPLVDSVIDAYEDFMDDPEGAYVDNGKIVTNDEVYASAKGKVFDHIRRQLIDQHGIDGNDIIEISGAAIDVGDANGYRAEEYREAMSLDPYEGAFFDAQDDHVGPVL